MNQLNTTLKSLLLGLGGALLATACTITLDPNGSGGGTEGDSDDAQCLELFETCVELAGESPGCDAVFEYCAGSGGEDGGVDPDPGCEENYINCLSEGVDPDACQPLLDACEPGGEDDGGNCSEDDPDCTPDPDPCDDGECGNDCEQLAETCVMFTGDEGACYGELLGACYANDCEGMLNACYGFGGDDSLCQELTGCYDGEPEPPIPDECEELLNDCYNEMGDEGYCQELYPECFEPTDPPEPSQCDWYYGECEGQFAAEFCQQGGQACEVGILGESFDCGWVFPDYCNASGLSDTACNEAENACWNGFFGIELCGSLSDDPANWLQQLAECNNWE